MYLANMYYSVQTAVCIVMFFSPYCLFDVHHTW